MTRSTTGPVCVFDAYGTLFDVHSAVMRHADRLGPVAKPFSAHWREKQLEYTWTRALMERYIDFWQASAFGWQSCWINRGGAPAEYTELPVREHRNLWVAIEPLLASVDEAH